MKPIASIIFTSFLFFNIACNKSADIQANLWQKLNTPYFGRLQDIMFTNADTGYIFGKDSSYSISTILKTFDGGKSWEEFHFSLITDSIGPVGPFNVSPFNSNILFAFSRLHNEWAIIRSTDGGYRWHMIDSTPNSVAWGKYHFYPSRYLRSGTYIYKSIDSGFTWAKVYNSQSGFAFFDMLQFPDSQTGYTAGGIAFDATNYGIMAKTTDGGNKWQAINYPFHDIEGMSFISNNIGYVAMNMDSGNTATTYLGGCDLYKTKNGGVTWSVVSKNIFSNYRDDNGMNLHFTNEQKGFVLGPRGVYHTNDGGKSWQNEFPSTQIIKLFFPLGNCCYAVDNEGNVYKRFL